MHKLLNSTSSFEPKNFEAYVGFADDAFSSAVTCWMIPFAPRKDGKFRKQPDWEPFPEPSLDFMQWKEALFPYRSEHKKKAHYAPLLEFLPIFVCA
jgi:hypothetical protein